MMRQAINEAKRIYQNLADEESKEIFRCRLLYSVTGDWSLIRTIVQKYLKGYEDIEIFIGIEHNLERLSLSNNESYVIYGAGEYGRQAYEYLIRMGISPAAFLDRSVKKQKEGFCNRPVLAPESVKEMENSKILIAVWERSEEIAESLIALGIACDRILNCFPTDYYSDENQYFDKEIIRYSDNEVFLDCGAFDMKTSQLFTKHCPHYKKIIAFEPDSRNAQICLELVKDLNLERTEVLPYGVWDQKQVLHFDLKGSSSSITDSGETMIQTITIDELDEAVTFLKMDIEGAELKALHGASKTIQRYQPKLAVCVYHNPEDMLEIASYLLSLVPEYRFYLRHYSNYYATETVLYAVIE